MLILPMIIFIKKVMIKRLLLCLMASCSFIFVANAQFGVTAGFNSSSIVNDNYDGLSGFNVGIKEKV